MRDQFLDHMQKRLDSIPEDRQAKHIEHLLPLIEQEQAKLHPFWFAKHLALRWWRMTHGSNA